MFGERPYVVYVPAQGKQRRDAPLPCTPISTIRFASVTNPLCAGVYLQRTRRRIAEILTVHDTFPGAVSNTAALFPRLFA
jgi:hypothetical protein